MPERIPFNLQVKLKRLECGMKKQSDLAIKAGLSQSYISKIESGKQPNIGLDELKMISKALDFDDWDLNLLGIQL